LIFSVYEVAEKNHVKGLKILCQTEKQDKDDWQILAMFYHVYNASPILEI
jgi:hypothetical protein